jgi:hypothetical protein
MLNAGVYERNCVTCHKKLPVSIDKYFYRYLLKYSSEREVKKAMYDYLKTPSRQGSVMGESFINRFGVKKRSHLSNQKLKKALGYYWERYKVFGKLK